MKHISLSIAVVAGMTLASCNSSQSGSSTNTGKDTTVAVSTDQQNLEKNRSVYKAIETGDSATIRSLIADDAIDHQGPNGGDLKGGGNITHMLTDMHNHVKDLKFEIISDAAKDDYIFAMVQMSGTALDNSMGMTPGAKVDGKSVDVVKVKDGKMVEHWGFLDWQDVMKMGQKPMSGKKEKK